MVSQKYYLWWIRWMNAFFFTKYEFSKTKNQDLKKGQEIYKTIVLSESQYYIEKLSKINQFKEKKKTLRSILNTENNCIS